MASCEIATAEITRDAYCTMMMRWSSGIDSSSIPFDFLISVDALHLAKEHVGKELNVFEGTIISKKWLKYVTQVRLSKRLTMDSFDDLFYYLQQFEKLVNVSRAKKRKFIEGSNATNGDRNCSKDSSNPRLQPRVGGSKYFMEQMVLAKHDELEVSTGWQNDFIFADASRMEEIEENSWLVVVFTLDVGDVWRW
ncbi:hypothetical protein Tco_0861578 [Tanacetum coccineum]|uniref:Protein FAR1-RELATED SEQUENCE n=1 Tax=Tanacetum coccineum TaxID=301880 RepID=A0ABQ5BLH3_9ASTR